jgi:hypothetical protein
MAYYFSPYIDSSIKFLSRAISERLIAEAFFRLFARLAGNGKTLFGVFDFGFRISLMLRRIKVSNCP